MRLSSLPELPDVIVIDPDIHSDSRGFLIELFQEARYHEITPERFVQDNMSRSTHGVIRAFHFQLDKPQGKLVTVLDGDIIDVAVDIRRGSPTFGVHAALHLSGATLRQLYIPPGFAHGFCVTGAHALVHYKCTQFYNPSSVSGIRWNDPSLAINWPVSEPILTDRDRMLPLLDSIDPEALPRYNG